MAVAKLPLQFIPPFGIISWSTHWVPEFHGTRHFWLWDRYYTHLFCLLVPQTFFRASFLAKLQMWRLKEGHPGCKPPNNSRHVDAKAMLSLKPGRFWTKNAANPRTAQPNNQNHLVTIFSLPSKIALSGLSGEKKTFKKKKKKSIKPQLSASFPYQTKKLLLPKQKKGKRQKPPSWECHAGRLHRHLRPPLRDLLELSTSPLEALG